MKGIITTVIVGVVGFVAGFAGLYLAMPIVSPELVASTRLHIDSLRAARSGVTPADSLAAGTDSTLSSLFDADGTIASLEDSLETLLADIAKSQQELENVVARGHQLERELQLTAEMKTEAAQLAQTLSKLDDDQLTDLVSHLEFEMLQVLYSQATGKNRARLLQSLPSDRAAKLVTAMVSRTETPVRDRS